MIISFQRRVRLWLAHNELFHMVYEGMPFTSTHTPPYTPAPILYALLASCTEHRHFLLIQRTQEQYASIEAYLDGRDPQLADAEAIAVADAAACKEKLKNVSSTQLRLARAQGELDGLLESAKGPLPSGAPRDVAEGKQKQGMATSEIEVLKLRAEVRG